MRAKDEDRVLRLAIARGWLDERHVTLADPESDTISEDDAGRGRVEGFVRRGLLDAGQLATLAQEAGIDEAPNLHSTMPDPSPSSERSEPPELVPELETWDRYRVGRLLGRGGSGVVYF